VKLTVTKTLKFHAFYGTKRFVTVFRTTPQWSLSWARWIQYTPPTLFH